ncbi:calmegin-like [Melanotaenia boesemani]|uniref:calmegin-like n=1 Tax=Melanotaenia boesemani TaxID=1250792 RepID=UPI001C03BC1B|nr:calmegin-like [Melanotaenia boesemani]
MEISCLTLGMMLVAHVTSVCAEQLGIIESILLSIHHRPWLLGVYVFAVGLPVILFISFMWPDKRFGPPDQPYYYKKSDDAQPDDPERKSADVRGTCICEEEAPSVHKRMLNKH